MSAKYSQLLSKLKPEQKPLQPETTETQTENLQSSDSVFDLSEHLSHQPTAPTAPVTGSTDENKTEGTEKPEETNFEDVERAAINTLLDPDMIAEGLADVVDLLRGMGYPKLYEKIMFKPGEQDFIAKAARNPESVHPNTYKAITEKLADFNNHVKHIEWEQKEKLQMIKHIFRPLADKLGPDSAVSKYYPLLIVLGIEGKRFKAVANSSNTIFVEDAPAPQPKAEETTRPPFTVVKEEIKTTKTEDAPAAEPPAAGFVDLNDYQA